MRWQEITAGVIVAICLVVLPAAALAYQRSRASQVVIVELSQWQFRPAEIRVKKGQDVRLQLFAKDVVHGFQIVNLVDLTVTPGKMQEFTFRADEVGVYRFRCSLFCGLGHNGMVGQIVVEE